MVPEIIEIKQGITGFDPFICSWLCRSNTTILIDVGPANSIPNLINTLCEKKIKSIDYVLLSHIHIDHAGGLGLFLDQFPMAKVVCHPKGIRHLVEPDKLWQASKKVLGEFTNIYGPYKPVAEHFFLSHTDFSLDDCRIVETPGHAPHHLSFIIHGYLFAGEAAGIYSNLDNDVYLRPATPPLFFFDEAIESIDTLISLGNYPLCFAHYGQLPDSLQILVRARSQLIRWKDIIAEQKLHTTHQEDILSRCINALLQKDKELKAFDCLSADSKKWEIEFLANSVKGFLSYLQKKETE